MEDVKFENAQTYIMLSCQNFHGNYLGGSEDMITTINPFSPSLLSYNSAINFPDYSLLNVHQGKVSLSASCLKINVGFSFSVRKTFMGENSLHKFSSFPSLLLLFLCVANLNMVFLVGLSFWYSFIYGFMVRGESEPILCVFFRSIWGWLGWDVILVAG
jgi:hypothetical protein